MAYLARPRRADPRDRHGHQAPDVKELAQFLIGRGLAKYKCPERVESLEEFPLTRVGKVDKPAMKRRIAQMLEQEAPES